MTSGFGIPETAGPGEEHEPPAKHTLGQGEESLTPREEPRLGGGVALPLLSLFLTPDPRFHKSQRLKTVRVGVEEKCRGDGRHTVRCFDDEEEGFVHLG